MIWNPWKEIARLRKEAEEDQIILDEYMAAWIKADMQIDDLIETLVDITSWETPRCSNVVRKITRMAREAIEKCTM
jgi:hypothetical protein